MTVGILIGSRKKERGRKRNKNKSETYIHVYIYRCVVNTFTLTHLNEDVFDDQHRLAAESRRRFNS